MTDQECLAFIREQYGAMIGAAALAWGHRPEVLAGIICRETRGGTSPLLDIPGPAGRGDGAHGHGLMQIDDRSYPDFCTGEQWKDPAANIDFGGRVLFEKRTYLSNHTAGWHFTTDEIEQAAIAGYNCGAGNVLKSLSEGWDVDRRTAHQDYSKTVLIYAEIYRALVPPEPIILAPVNAPKVSSGLMAFILRIFRR